MADLAVQPPSTSPTTHLPSPPNPSEDAGLIPKIGADVNPAAIPSPPVQHWDASTMSAEIAMKMLCRAVQALASVNGDIPPTPALQRPSTPRSRVQSPSPLGSQLHPQAANVIISKPNSKEGSPSPAPGQWKRSHIRNISRPATPVPDADLKAPGFFRVDVGSPEAHFNEPAAAYSPGSEDGPSTPPIPRNIQQEAIARKFFSKAPPPVGLDEYMARLQRYCPMSTAVYLAAGTYIHKISVAERIVPITPRTVHRLILASLRVAMKALEDLRYPQQRFAGVGGVKESELKALEISLCYLTNFDLQVDNNLLYNKMVELQQAAVQANISTSRMQDAANMRLRLPVRVGPRFEGQGLQQTAAMSA